MDKIKDGTGDYTFIEIMGCPGGCINGGGQPIQHAVVRNFVDLKERRAKALYESDKIMRRDARTKTRLSRSCMMNSSVSREATRLMKYCTQLMWHVKVRLKRTLKIRSGKNKINPDTPYERHIGVLCYIVISAGCCVVSTHFFQHLQWLHTHISICSRTERTAVLIF